MLHLLYILAFTIIAFIAVSNLIRSLVNLSLSSRRPPESGGRASAGWGSQASRSRTVPHPEMLDEGGQPINEPLLVMRSVDVEEARERLDALYNDSPSNKSESEE